MNIYTIILVPLLYISFGYILTYAFYYFAFALRFITGYEIYILSVLGTTAFSYNLVYLQYYVLLLGGLFYIITYFFKMFRSSS